MELRCQMDVLKTNRTKFIFLPLLNKKYSYKQIFQMLSKYKKVRTNKNGQWEDVTKLKYIEDLTNTLDV